jgi:ribosomal protein L27
LFALVAGAVKFGRRRGRNVVNITTVDAASATADSAV